MTSVYEAAGGSAGMLRLATAWHQRVVADEVVGHAFRHGVHPHHTERLAAYWGEALGGPPGPCDETGVVRLHSGNGDHDDMNERAVACFDQALTDAGFTEDPLRQVLHDYFTWATTVSLYTYREPGGEVPAGLTVPQWSWDGLRAAHQEPGS